MRRPRRETPANLCMASFQFPGSSIPVERQNRNMPDAQHKVRERLQELDKLKTAEQGNVGLLDGDSTQSFTQASNQTSTRRTNLVHCNAAVQVKTSTIASTVPQLAFSTLSESSDSAESAKRTQFISEFGDSPFSSSASPDKGGDEASSIDDFFIGLCSGDSTEADTLLKSAVGGSQLWTPPASENADSGFELFGPMDPSAANTQKAELRFTELMLKIRAVGFADMESSKSWPP
ncbi:hypothetical protein ANO11243_032960 [Dothideomycetidae sp. 11243]|nr:hypothetical protein ANO11243_032960 [fungal sp. No.11243]